MVEIGVFDLVSQNCFDFSFGYGLLIVCVIWMMKYLEVSLVVFCCENFDCDLFDVFVK